ncbi:hypothetical protein P389DRAFT_140803 [Cystobasidium minutum MCA 4210]|uniref:uncharacterized protein n=1 Tax=Cystobasidium minutum MCA 4210 TaxID=1397322 RepID=UPI0034CFA360|eukprot:jgi/Rhomi1/140803/e_gw1.2.766.1
MLRTCAIRSKPCFRPILSRSRVLSDARYAFNPTFSRVGCATSSFTFGTKVRFQSTSSTPEKGSLSANAPGNKLSQTQTKSEAVAASTTQSTSSDSEASAKSTPLRENIYTIPNLLTVSRIISCPFLGYFIVNGNFVAATSLLFYAGVSDLIDGWLARKYNMGTVFGSILDPAADKALMTTLTIALAMKGLLPVSLAVLILGRDVALSISAFYFRYISLPEPKTFKRYWDFSIPSAEVKPTQISKYNTFLQLVLMGVTTVSPLVPFNIAMPLKALQAVVAGTTIWSGLSYVGGRQGLRILTQAKEAVKKP